MQRLLTLSLFVFSIWINTTHAEIFSWVDANGQRHYGDEKPKNQSSKQVKIKPNISGYQMINQDLKDLQKEGIIPQEYVIMYSTAWCGYCKKARKYFHTNAIKFKERDIEKSRHAKQDYKDLGGKNVPFFFYKGQTHRGFHPTSFGSFYDGLNRNQSAIN